MKRKRSSIKYMYIVSDGPSSTLYVYKKVEDALKQCREYDEAFELGDIEELEEHGAIYHDACSYSTQEAKCVKISYDEDTDDINDWYSLTIHSDGGGQCYSNQYYVYVGGKEDMICDAVDWYYDEHNRDDECKYCSKKSRKACTKRFKRRLNKKLSAWITQGRMSATICKLDVVL